MEAAGESWQLARIAPMLAGRPVLLVGTRRDAVTPHALHHDPLVAAYADGHLEHHVFATDHALSDHRVTLARTVLGFLRHIR
jgi:uncharacterized protein